jgi:hypothetical protein
MSDFIKFFVNGFGYLTPKNDVTALEAVHLNLVIAAVTNNPTGDFQNYIKQHNLERHFTEEVL